MNSETKVIFDKDSLLRRVGGRETLFIKILKTFLGNVPVQIENLELALSKRSQDDLHLCAHTLKGSSANVEALALRDVAFEMEVAAKDGRIDDIAEMVDVVRDEFADFRDLIVEQYDLG